MIKIIPIVILLWMLSLIGVGAYSYNKGIAVAQAKMQTAVTKQVESNIHTTNDNMALVESLNEYNLKNWEKLLYPPATVIKYIRESQVCESGKISQEVINVINGAIK
jgi:hypothetical protein